MVFRQVVQEFEQEAATRDVHHVEASTKMLVNYGVTAAFTVQKGYDGRSTLLSMAQYPSTRSKPVRKQLSTYSVLNPQS